MTSSNSASRPPWILPVIVFSQFAGTSLWFAGNAILPELQQSLGLGDVGVGSITSAVQFGFIVGTLAFAIGTISDRFSPRLVFLICAVFGSMANVSVYFLSEGLYPLLLLRFLTGFFLAGIYPVGMKIAADWYQHGLGKAIGFLVGALVLGTAFPHLMRALPGSWSWEVIMIGISVVATAGGILLYLLVPNGPYRKPAHRFSPGSFLTIFKSRSFRAASFGYFGHMWELYTFWAFVPVILTHYFDASGKSGNHNISLWSFVIISVGSLSCAVGGILSQRKGSAVVARTLLMASGLCCLLSPLLLSLPEPLFLLFLLIWGLVVIGDSPQFSALSAQTAPPELVGTALTLINSIGFFITILSIQLMEWFVNQVDLQYALLILAVGPLFGLYSMRHLFNKKQS